ncbi:sulfite exporter TauE/SafE family protein [Companilactobacillus formosensis]|uniref:sulfite exporter TauE/SafE family protein n=1 Tax=Companilactobacillus formosensis TaxID=1617889 RepID=UPI001FEA4FF8|nr:sulfite exporter TauE/SafE family protein [Companilactobacillus formosensis]
MRRKELIMFNFILILVFLGGIFGGMISSVAGGASIVSYPILLISGVPPIFANITNHGALIFDYLGAISSSTEELKGHWKQSIFYAMSATVGAVFGTYLLLAFPSKVFEKVVPIFLVLSGILFLIGNKKKNSTRVIPKFLIVVIMFMMGCYTGYFGGANGVILLAALDYLTNENFLVNNAIKNVICGLANVVAFVIFIFRSQVYWLQGIFLAAGMLIGGFLGPRILRHISIVKLRWVIAILAFIQANYFFIQSY